MVTYVLIHLEYLRLLGITMVLDLLILLAVIQMGISLEEMVLLLASKHQAHMYKLEFKLKTFFWFKNCLNNLIFGKQFERMMQLH